MRAWTLLILAMLGCGQAPVPEAPVDDIDAAYQRVVNPVPPPPEESPLGSAVESYLDAAAADAENPRVEVEMLTATWCGPCKTAHAKVVPWLREKGYTVHETDVSDFSADDLNKAYAVKGLPTFIFRDGKTNKKVTGPRYDTKGNPYTPDFAAAFAAFPPPPKDAVSFGMSVPAISVADLTENVAGMDQDLFGVVHVTVPKDVSWDVKHLPSSVLLTFKPGKQPSLRSLKYVRANPNLVSVEISPKYAEFKTDSYWPMLRTVRVEFDWAPPVAKSAKPVAFPARGRYYTRPQPQYRPVPQVQKPKPVVITPEPTPAPPEPITLGKSCPVVVQVAHTYRASVCIWLKRDCTVYDFLGVPSVKEGKGCGSGMIVSATGHILTCAHVVDGVKSIEVEFCDGQKRPAKIIEADKKTDLAILKVEGVDLPSVTWAKESPMVGADAWMVGNPHGRGESVARGIVAGYGREVESEDYNHKGLTHVSIVINPGNSGGPVVNSKGECFGVINAMVGDHGGLDAQGIAFCIPFSRATEFVNRVVN